MSKYTTHESNLPSSNALKALGYYHEFFSLGVGLEKTGNVYYLNQLYNYELSDYRRTHDGQGFSINKYIGSNKLITLYIFICDNDNHHIYFNLKVYPRFKSPFLGTCEKTWFLNTVLHDTFHLFDTWNFIEGNHVEAIDRKLKKFFKKQSLTSNIDWSKSYDNWLNRELTLKECITKTQSSTGKSVSAKTIYNIEKKLKKVLPINTYINRALIEMYISRIELRESRASPLNFIISIGPRDIHYCDIFIKEELRILRKELRPGIIPGRFKFLLRKAI